MLQPSSEVAMPGPIKFGVWPLSKTHCVAGVFPKELKCRILGAMFGDDSENWKLNLEVIGSVHLALGPRWLR